MYDELRNTAAKLMEQGKRLDGRGLEEYRTPIKIEKGISKNAEGSARVQIGKTVVLVGVKLGIDHPYSDTPDEGTILVNAELTPLSSPEYEAGPPGSKAVELARIVDRGIRESKAIDLKKLCITPGEKVWTIAIDIVTINDDGNLFDAAGLAALAALQDAYFPEFDGVGIDYKKKTSKALPLIKEPLPITVFKLGNSFFVDPGQQEEKIYDVRLTIATTADGKICALQKGGEATLTIADVEKMIDIAGKKARWLRSTIGRAVHDNE